MFNFKNKKGLLHSFRKNEDGNMALTFALSLTVLVGALGTATDFSSLSRAYSKSQSIADSTALIAAIYVKDNNRPPENDEDGYRDGVNYTAADLGFNFNNSVQGGADNVTVRVDYDDNAKEATVTVEGETTPNFSQIFGKDKLPFSAQSVVSYLEVEDSFPASITLVLDNSGSMSWDDTIAADLAVSFLVVNPPNARPRIDGLKTSVNSFTRDLRNRLGTEQQGRRTIRMGLLPYNSNIVAAGERPLDWGYTSQEDINNMVAAGNTNSNPPMTTADTWMLNEQAFHTNEARLHSQADRDALKFVVFMTDGQNTIGSNFIIPGKTGRWHRINTGSSPTSRTFFFNGSTEGTLTSDTDVATLEACTRMKDTGVQIYTIGYALEPGFYNANVPNNNFRFGSVSEQASITAFSLLQGCASSDNHFIRAADGNELEAAFDEIQNAIVEELIRIKS